MNALPSKLTREIARYEELKPSLLKEHEGEWVLIKGDELVGLFPTWEEAYDTGRTRFGNVPILVHEVAEFDMVHTIWSLP